jgi:hypothetical protein
MQRLRVLPFLLVCLFGHGSIQPGTTYATSETTSFTTYAEALQYVRSTYDGEFLQTPESSWIGSGEYYHADGLGYFILNVKTGSRKSYIHQGVPGSVWEGFRAAPSKGRYYNRNLKGRYRLFLAGQIEQDQRDQEEGQVYITSSGSKYHRKWCGYLKGDGIAMNIAEAARMGLTPCSTCNP